MYELLNARISFVFLAAAMVFENHYISFDGRLHSFEIPSPKYQYVLIHDFQNSDFTVLKIKDAIKIKNKDMKVVIFNNGKVSTKFSGGKIVYGLPVETNAAKCLRKENLIFCDFPNDKFQVVTNLKHTIVTIAVSTWHHGKLQGKDINMKTECINSSYPVLDSEKLALLINLAKIPQKYR